MKAFLREWVEQMAAAPLAGIDAGSSAVKVAEVERAGGRVVLRSCALGKRDGAGAAELLKRTCAEAGIRTREAALGLSSPEIVVKAFQFPRLSKAELPNAVRLEGESLILNGHTMDEMAMDWHLLPSASAGSLRGILAVVPKTVMEVPLQAARSAGLQPAVVDVEGLALWSAYWALTGRNAGVPKTTLLINVGVSKTNLVVARGRDDLILARDFQPAAGSEKDWLTEVRDSLDYARSGAGLRELEQIVLTGGGSDDRQASRLQSALGVPATRWNPFQHLAREGQARELDESAGLLFGIAVGLALRRPT